MIGPHVDKLTVQITDIKFLTTAKNSAIVYNVYFDNDKLPRIIHFDIEQPYNSKNICDPTSIIVINNKKYLITAETDASWFCEYVFVYFFGARFFFLSVSPCSAPSSETGSDALYSCSGSCSSSESAT